MDAQQNDILEAEIAARLARVAAQRRSRLLWLLDERYKGHQANLSGDIEMNPGELSQILNANRFFGEKKARRMEVLLKLPPLWLDAAEIKTPDDRVAEDIHWVYRHANADGRGVMTATLYAVNDNFVPKDKRLNLSHTTMA